MRLDLIAEDFLKLALFNRFVQIYASEFPESIFDGDFLPFCAKIYILVTKTACQTTSRDFHAVTHKMDGILLHDTPVRSQPIPFKHLEFRQMATSILSHAKTWSQLVNPFIPSRQKAFHVQFGRCSQPLRSRWFRINVILERRCRKPHGGLCLHETMAVKIVAHAAQQLRADFQIATHLPQACRIRRFARRCGKRLGRTTCYIYNSIGCAFQFSGVLLPCRAPVRHTSS